MAHFSKISVLLDCLITCSVAEAARRVGMSERSVWRYLVRSKMGDPKLQEIEFCGVVAPFHVQLSNARALAAEQIQQNAIERARDGVLVDVFFQGQRMYERVLKEQYKDFTDRDFYDLNISEDERYELIATKQRLKPSDALTIKMLESWSKKYRPTSDHNVSFGGKIELLHPADAPSIKTIEHQGVFEEVEDTEQRTKGLALAPPAKDSAEMDRMAARGDFDPAPVSIVGADGNRVEMTASSPLRRDLEERLAKLKANGPEHPFPLDKDGHRTLASTKGRTADDDVADDITRAASSPTPHTSGKPAYAKPTAGSGVMGRGAGPDPNLVGGAQGFKTV